MSRELHKKRTEVIICNSVSLDKYELHSIEFGPLELKCIKIILFPLI